MLNTRMERLTAAERSRIGDLYARHADDAARLAYLLTGDRAQAEDLVQDAFVKLAGRLVHLRDPDAFGAYLRSTIVNLSRSHFRRKRVERAYAERIAQPGPAPAGASEDRETMWRALGTLSNRQRAAIVLRYYEDLSEAQTAEILQCRPGTVKSLVSRGLDTLRTQIRGDDE
jgi:RNA polymerase sigma-70 factor (sigma-E family)